MIKSSEAAAALREKLQQGKTNFVFKKKDGSKRNAIGTLNFNIIPQEDTQFKSEERSEERDDQVTYYDLEKMAWRCCKNENILEIEGEEISDIEYEVRVKFDGSDGWQKICSCSSKEEAEDEVKHQKSIEDNGDCEYQIKEVCDE